jgi:hypothetical protein
MPMRWILLIALAVVALAWGASVWSIAQPFAGKHEVKLAARADPARVEATVRALTERFPHRHPGVPEQLEGAGTWLEGQMNALEVAPARESFAVRGQTLFNLVSTLGATDGARVVVGAHYDAHPATPGADDNASGVAAVLELARILKATPLPCPVELALWTAEEPPYFRTQDMGSARHAQRLHRENTCVRAMFSLEMLGYFTDAASSQSYPPRFVARPLYPSTGNFVLLLGDSHSTTLTRRIKAAFAGTSTLPIESANVPRTMGGADFSDHLNFWNAGITAFMVTDSAFLRNPNYHRDSDKPETLDFQRLAAATNGVAAMIHEACAEP